MQDDMMNGMGGLLGPEMGMSAEGMSDVDMAVEEAAMMGGMEAGGFGTEMASEEEHMMLEQIMDFIEGAIHGKATQNLVAIMQEHPAPFEGIAQASHAVIVASYMKGNEAGLEQNADIYLAENGVVQETVELMWELATAANVVDENDDEMLSAAYFDTIRLVGETLLEGENPEAIASAQELLMELELDQPVDSEEYMNEMPVDDPMMAQAGMGPDPMAGGMGPNPMAGGMAPQGGMPPVGY
jgi:hypothetical protein